MNFTLLRAIQCAPRASGENDLEKSRLLTMFSLSDVLTPLALEHLKAIGFKARPIEALRAATSGPNLSEACVALPRYLKTGERLLAVRGVTS